MNNLIFSIETKHVYTIYAFYVKSSQLTAVVCTTWLRAYRAYKRAYKKAYKRGNALLLGKTVNQKCKVELFKQKKMN